MTFKRANVCGDESGVFMRRFAARLFAPTKQAFEPFAPLREELERPFKDRVFLWPRKGGKEGDLVAMSNPDQQNKPAGAQQGGALKALGKS